MSVTLRWFGGAAEAAGRDEELADAGRLSVVLADAARRHGADLERVVARCSVLVDGRVATEDDPEVPDGAVVDVLPPFAGG